MSAQERTEKATPKRRQDARKRGQVPRSRELGAAAVVGAAALVVLMAGPHVAAAAQAQFRALLSFDGSVLLHPEAMPARFGQALGQALLSCLPIFIACVVAALAAPLLLGGWNFSAQALRPDFSRINPLSGLGRIFSGHGAVELFKGLVKISWIGGIAAFYLSSHRQVLAGLSAEATERGIADGVGLALGLLGWLSLALVVIAGFDAPYQLWSHGKRLRMSKQEIRDEMKQSDGRPEVKGRIRRMQLELSKRRMMDKVAKADVVVTNPTHYAVALKYDGEQMRAPRLVAKGAGEVAAAIRELAREHRVPLVSAPPLARALYRGVQLDQEIPAQLYAAVARVLTYVYQLRAWRGGTRPPVEPVVDEVPGGEPDPE